MSSDQSSDAVGPAGWPPADTPTIGAGSQAGPPNGASNPGGPKKRWPYVVLIAVSLSLVTAGGTVIALSLAGENDQISTSAERASPDTKTAATGPSGSSGDDDAASDEDAEDTSVTLDDRPSPSVGATDEDDLGQADVSDDLNTDPAFGTREHTLGAISFDVPSGFTAMVEGEVRDDGALRSEFQGPGGQQVVVEVNPDNSSDGLASAQELAGNFRDQGRLLREPYADEVGGNTTGVLAIRGTDGDYRSDHFLTYDGYGMAVLGIDLSSLEAADSLARSVIPTIQS